MKHFRYWYFFGMLLVMALFTGCTGSDEDTQLFHIQSAETVQTQTDRNAGQTGQEKEETASETYQAPVPVTSEQRLVGVYVHGAVRNPGVYYLPENSRVCDAVLSAGGFTKKAAKHARNQAEYLTDGEELKILTRKEYRRQKRQQKLSVTEKEEAPQQTPEYAGLININTATKEELMTLPGIGASKADAILSFRDEQGKFSSIEDIMQVPGVKEGVFALMKDEITV